MKCIVLAGGSGDRLWPLSRKNFPKQFMEIKKGRSMFQEAILRNMPFCDEFIVITNKKYENIARGQLQYFQGLNYTILLENTPLKTAPSVVISALYAQPDEELLIVFTDHVIEGEYNPAIVRLKSIIKSNKIAAIGIRPRPDANCLHFFDVGGKKVKFTSRETKNCYYDCGLYGGKASVILQNINPDFVDRCRNIGLQDGVFEDVQDPTFALGLDKVLNTNNLELVEAYFSWTRITDISSYYKFIGRAEDQPTNIIEFDNKNVEIVNRVDDQLVVANGLRDVLIANTRDAIYITQINKESNIKEVSKKYYINKNRFFEESPVFYEKWGSKDILNRTDNCEVSRVTIYPNRSYSSVTEEGFVENYFITEGEAKISVGGGEKKKYFKDSSILIRSATEYSIFNESKRNLVMVKTRIAEFAEGIKKKKKSVSTESLVKLRPVFKEFLWGGTKIRDVLKKPVGSMECVAESWELSAHPAGQSVIATGKYKGFLFTDYLAAIGKDQLGWKTLGYERFPLMVKFIDARQSLSIQVHPNDDYAFPIEGDYGKNEMWYVMGADEGASIYVGFNRNVTAEEIRERIKKNTLLEVLNKVPVKKGETYFLRPGTVHAIGAGCLICEVQQSSNITYRLYDYGRRDKNGKFRELNIDKALDVMNFRKEQEDFRTTYPSAVHDGYTEKLIGECKYFSVRKYDLTSSLKLIPSESTFQVVIIIEGKCKIGNGSLTYPSEKGDTWFCGNWDTIEISGKCSVLVVNI
ncbi:MAG: type I phosphomannose isomerase catalytic subunit [Clostridia bacterium]|nr:type I phosphomannose isomerase catalytic subunit [Clostridia bacterium]